MITNPLEQFQITSLIPIRLGNVDISFTNSSLFMVLACITIILFFTLATFNSTIIPPGTPILLAPFLVPIEIVSFISKPFSLAIRLFANMMSGHSLLKILAGFAWTMLSIGGIFYIIQLVPLFIVFLITGLEIG